MAPNVNSRVARRMLLLFVVASLIPLGILALLTFYKVGSNLEEEVGSSLRRTAKSVAMDFHLRMVVAHEQIQTISGIIAEDGLGDDAHGYRQEFMDLVQKAKSIGLVEE